MNRRAQRRTRIVSICLTDNEHALVLEASRRACIPRAVFARVAVLAASRLASDKVLDEIWKLLAPFHWEQRDEIIGGLLLANDEDRWGDGTDRPIDRYPSVCLQKAEAEGV